MAELLERPLECQLVGRHPLGHRGVVAPVGHGRPVVAALEPHPRPVDGVRSQLAQRVLETGRAALWRHMRQHERRSRGDCGAACADSQGLPWEHRLATRKAARRAKAMHEITYTASP